MNVQLPIEAIRAASANPAVMQRVGSLYEALEAEIAARGPTCWNRGVCCNFGQYGHRLFVTPLELAWFLSKEGGCIEPSADASACPHKTDQACGVRAARPMGCRVFYCQEGTEIWQNALSETFHRRLVELHLETGTPYSYCEWLEALRQITHVGGIRSTDLRDSTHPGGEITQSHMDTSPKDPPPPDADRSTTVFSLPIL